MSEQSYVPLAVGEGYFSDWQSPISADDGKTWVWNHAQQKYVPQALSAGLTDHALLTHLDFASSGHTGFEQAGAGVAAVAAHVALADPHGQYLLASNYTAADVFAKVLTLDGGGSGLDADLLDGLSSAAFATAGHSHTIAHSSTTGLVNDDHTQYLLASGSRNGAATIVSSSINDTPLTLKLASGQVADGFKLRDNSDADLIYANRYGDLSIGGSVFNDYEDGGGDETAFYVSRTFTDVNGHFADYAYLSGGFVDIGINDTSISATHTDNYVFGIGGQAYTYPGCTYVPYGLYGLRYLTYNLSTRPVQDMIGALIDCETSATGGTDSLIGAKIVIAGGAGTIATGRAVYLPAPANTPYTLLVGLDIESFAISGASEKYAIRTQGGQVLHQAGVNTVVPLVAQQAASASDSTADAIQSKNSAGTVQFAVGALGRIKTNQAATNTHVPSGATAKQLPVYDTAGTLLGYIPIYGSAW